MNTQIETQDVVVRSEKILAWTLIAGGALLIAPYSLLIIQRRTTSDLGALFAGGIALGHVWLLLVLFAVPFFGTWIRSKTGDRDAAKAFLWTNAARYAPVFVLGVLHLFLVTRNRWFFVPPFFGGAAIAYAAVFLARIKR